MQGLGFRVYGWGFWFMVCRVYGSGFRVEGCAGGLLFETKCLAPPSKTGSGLNPLRAGGGG